jgi:hypothetical protein
MIGSYTKGSALILASQSIRFMYRQILLQQVVVATS